MNTELLEALTILEQEKNISKDTMMDAIENSLISACKNHFGTSDNIKVIMNRETCDYAVFAEKEVVDEVMDPALEISLEEAEQIDSSLQLGDVAQIRVESKSFGRIATQNAKNLILQKIREEERKVVFDQYFEKERDIVTGIVQRYVGKNISINLGRADAMLTENEQVKGEVFQPTERIKLYIVEVKNTPKGPKILVSRTHPELVKRLFEAEVTEVSDGTVEIKSIAREAGSRTKMAVWSNDDKVDPVGACVGLNGSRVNAVVSELRGEKIDIINWSDNPALLIENALSPAKVISVMADPDEKAASVIVPDYQLSLAIGKEGQNARLAARLTGYKIDIKSETQAIESGELPADYMDQMEMMDEDGYVGEYEPYDEYEDDGNGADYGEGGAGYEDISAGYGDGYGDEASAGYEEAPAGYEDSYEEEASAGAEADIEETEREYEEEVPEIEFVETEQ
ncbi:transcription termination factor NusA [Schaedlerella arabinosiphila]|uniref:transcription termination factor NusA n=1 Tax=Schaedlerella arabinosiphila TaxID=2044587 RepID=UPI00255837D8|nr:transcription termination factor NusA [Schaedlerella arabinosiphila]